ncbi:hypothetical protein SOVF_041400 [Spinacia oleracea]|nr:hypothetical protein SOVF_041400 [Spinacia oleracea]
MAKFSLQRKDVSLLHGVLPPLVLLRCRLQAPYTPRQRPDYGVCAINPFTDFSK